MAAAQFPSLSRLPFLPKKRLAALEPGSHRVKILLAEPSLGSVRVARREIIDMHEEGLLSAEDLARHLTKVLRETKHHQIALALPQHLTLSQIVEIPPERSNDVATFIQEETLKLSGLTESTLTYDFLRLQPFGRYQNPHWVTLSRESELLAYLRKFGLAREDLCEITSQANALISAYLHLQPNADRKILIDVGAESTLAAILLNGQGVFAASFATGSQKITEAIAQENRIPIEDAESRKRTQNLFLVRRSDSLMRQALENWWGEIARGITDWLREHSELELNLASFQIVLSGGGAEQPGLVAFLRQQSGAALAGWPSTDTETAPSGPFAIAFGSALQAFNLASQTASLLPADLRKNWEQHHSLQRLYSATFFLILLIAVLLLAGAWRQFAIINRKNALFSQTQQALTRLNSAENLMQSAVAQYAELRPLFQRQRQTLDTLATLSWLQEVRSNQNYWYALFADQQSYYLAPQVGLPEPAPHPAPQTSDTNAPPIVEPPPRTNALPPIPPLKYGFIAELALPAETEAQGLRLGAIVHQLQQHPLLRQVDVLPADRQRSLIDPKAALPNRQFPLTIELVENPFLAPALFQPRASNVIATPPRNSPAPSFKQRADRALSNAPPPTR